MATELSDVKTFEVSLVKAGANLKPRFPIFKKDHEQEIFSAVLETAAEGEECIAKSEFSDAGKKAVVTAYRALSAFADELPAGFVDGFLGQCGVEKATWAPADINNLPDSSFLYVEGGGKLDAEKKTEPRSLRHFPIKDADGAIDLPHLRNAIARIPQAKIPGLSRDDLVGLQEKAQKLLAAESKDVSKTNEDKTMADTTNLTPDSKVEPVVPVAPAVPVLPVPKPEDVPIVPVDKSKGDVEAVMKSQAAEIETLRKSLNTLEAERAMAMWVEKARVDLSHFPGKSTEELATTLKKLADLDPELAKSQFETMKAASDAMKQSDLLKSAGSGTRSDNTDGSAWAEIQKKAVEIRKSDATLTIEQARAKATKENPELYQQYLTEHSAK